MTRYDRLLSRIKSGERILIDGATGTEIERRGVPQLDNAWNGGGALSDPDILRQVHQDYIGQGAEIIISNTFATHRHALQDAGVEAQFEALNRRGVELAIEARENMATPDVLVAGGISYWSWSGNKPSLSTLRENITDQAAILAAAGADHLMLEMMIDLDRMETTLAAAETSGLPVWVGLSCKPDEAGTMCLWNGETLSDALTLLTERQVPLISIMHTRVGFIDDCLDVVTERWSGPFGVYAHSGGYEDKHWLFDSVITPEDYTEQGKRWLGRGVQVLGGCCGIGVDHIAALREII